MTSFSYNHGESVRIVMDTLLLRPYERQDRAAFKALFGDREVMRYAGDGVPLDAAAAHALFDKIFALRETDPAFFIWAVEANGTYAGHAELKRRSGRSEYEIVFILAREWWGGGLGGRIVDRLLEEAKRRELPFVIATVHAENAASLAILKRRGFRTDEHLSAGLGCGAYRLELRGGETGPAGR